MNIRTKVIATIIAMICSLSVSATGIAAIMLEFPIQVANGTRLTIGEVQGDLWGRRKGANNFDFDEEHLMPLFKNGDGVQEAEMNLFCQDVSFSSGSRQIEYVFMFILAENATNGALVCLKEGTLTNQVNYRASYQYGFGKDEPDWASAKHMEAGVNIPVESGNRILYLRAVLDIIEGTVARVNTGAVWSFTYEFTGIYVQDGEN